MGRTGQRRRAVVANPGATVELCQTIIGCGERVFGGWVEGREYLAEDVGRLRNLMGEVEGRLS